MSELIGSQVPTLRVAPEYQRTEGDVALEFAETLGYRPFPWQRELLRDGLALDDSGRLAAQAVTSVIARQNGKSLALEIVVLYALFVAKHRKVLYTAHRAETAKSIFERIQAAIRNSPMLQGALKRDRVGGIRTGNGHWQITLRTGQEAHFRTRTNDSGRGLDALSLLIIDEVQNYTDEQQAALRPIVSSARNPQIWYAGSAGGQHSTVMGKLVAAAESSSPGIVYHGWHADEDDPPGDLATWVKTNPSLGAILEVDTVQSEFHEFGAHFFGRERLGIGDYPRGDGESWVIPRPSWDGRLDLESEVAGPVVLVPETTIDLEWSTIGLAGRRGDGDIHVEPVAHERGAAWLAPRLRELTLKHDVLGIAVDPKMPTGDRVLAELADMRIRGLLGRVQVLELTAEHVKGAFSWMYEAAKLPRDPGSPGWERGNPGFRHRGPEILTDALKAATTRKLLDKLAWSRQTEADVTALISCDLAGYAVPLLEALVKPPPPLPRTSRDPAALHRAAAKRSNTADLMTAGF